MGQNPEIRTADQCEEKKNACPDCLVCQFCSDTRCSACRSGRTGKEKMSFQEQIERFEALNKGCNDHPFVPVRIK